MRKVKHRRKFFPFAAGIPWSIELGKYIIPSVDLEIWNNSILNKDGDFYIVSFGGMIESFFSLSIAEAIKSIKSNVNIKWIGNNKYIDFLDMQKLCKIGDVAINKTHLKQYPTPIFFDKNDNVYFNILNNYLTKYSYWGLQPKEVKEPIFKQIAKNITIPWNDYYPRIRKVNCDFLNNFVKTKNIKPKTKIITIVLNDNVKDNVLNWNLHNIKEFVQIFYLKGYKVVIFADNIYKYHGMNCSVFEMSNLWNVVQMIQRSFAVLSNNIDWLLISLLVGDSALFSNMPKDERYDLFANSEFLIGENSNNYNVNDIFINNEGGFLPIDVFNIIEEI